MLGCSISVSVRISELGSIRWQKLNALTPRRLALKRISWPVGNFIEILRLYGFARHVFFCEMKYEINKHILFFSLALSLFGMFLCV